MIKIETTGGNVKLAIFIGDIPDNKTRLSFIKKCHIQDLRYHLDWNSLIYIAEHIRSYRLHVNEFLIKKLSEAILSFDKEKVWRAEVSYVKWVERAKKKEERANTRKQISTYYA